MLLCLFLWCVTVFSLQNKSLLKGLKTCLSTSLLPAEINGKQYKNLIHSTCNFAYIHRLHTHAQTQDRTPKPLTFARHLMTFVDTCKPQDSRVCQRWKDNSDGQMSVGSSHLLLWLGHWSKVHCGTVRWLSLLLHHGYESWCCLGGGVHGYKLHAECDGD